MNAPDSPIAELDLTVRTYNTLSRYGIDTISELTRKRADELQALPNFGQVSLGEIRRKLARRGLSLAPTTCPYCGGPMDDV